MAASRTIPSSSRPSSAGILDQPVHPGLYGVGTASARLLERLRIRTIGDLLWHLPQRYEDFSKVVPLRSLVAGQKQTSVARLARVSQRRTGRGQPLTEAELDEADGTPSRVKAAWFGRTFVKQSFPEGQVVRLSGDVRWIGRGLQFSQPKIEPADREAVHTARIVPIYRLTEGVKEGQLRRWLHTAVEGARDRSGKAVASALVTHAPEPLPDDLRARHGLPGIAEALRHVHFPDDPLALFRARRRLAFDELLGLQLALAQRRAERAEEADAPPLRARDGELETWVGALPFTLTAAQRRSLDQIRGDLGRRVPMSRLLQGDVGSGKTVVAALATRIAVASGAQAALMAPTELLAEQHFRTLGELFERGGPKIELLTSSVTGDRRARILERLADRSLDVVVGTHALVEEEVGFARLGLVVVDEQHRFGVRQRATLREKGASPHVLLTTATPIPQTLWQTLYRDLDVSVIDELPVGRQPIRTEVRPPGSLPRIWAWLKERVALGEQAFVVCPRIDADDVADAPASAELFERSEPAWLPSAVATEEELRRGPLAGLRLALVHGRMPQRERDAVMTRFRDRAIDVLVATTVIEVGIDIPGATAIVVLGAERFGLAQLHQLRGRVGRREQRAYCVLVSPATDSDRLRAMTDTKHTDRGDVPLDGFDLAKRDLQIRGPGQFLGAEQSGFLEHLRVVDLVDVDPKLLEDTSAEADAVVRADPRLERPEHAGLRAAVDDLWRRYGQV